MGTFLNHEGPELTREVFLKTRNENYITRDGSALLQPILDRALQSPLAIAVSSSTQTVTYKNLLERAESCAQALSASGVIPGDRVAFLITDPLFAYSAILGILKLSATYVPLDPRSSTERNQALIQQADPRIVLVDGSRPLEKSFSAPLLDIRTTSTAPILTAPHQTTHPAYILFTSGSTGTPKGVVMGASALCNLISWHTQQSGFSCGARTAQFAPLTFDVSFQEIFATLWTGGTLIPVAESARLDPTLFLNLIFEEQIERIFLPFVALQSLCETAQRLGRVPSSLREVVTAGEQLRITPALSWFFRSCSQCRLHNHYGPTETHVATSWTLPRNVDTWPTLPSIGTPISGATVELRDDQGRPVAPGTIGEIWIGGVCLAEGYLGRADLTRERFIVDPLSAHRFYRTGDLAQRAQDGTLEYVGRADFQVKIRGHRIELGEVESALSSVPGVQHAVAHAHQVKDSKVLVAYLVIDPNITPSDSDIRSALEKILPHFMMPSLFVRLADLPRTSSGKIDRAALPPPVPDRSALTVPYAAPENETHALMVTTWKEILGIESVGIDDSFFELGGSSLSAVRCIAALHEAGMTSLSVGKLYDAPTIRKLSRTLAPPSTVERSRPSVKDRGPIAIVGMSLRVPGANTVEQFWNNLTHGKESITFFKTFSNDLPPHVTGHPSYVNARGVLENAECFDASLFGVTPREAELMDPQQRVLLELAWEAMEHAGIPPRGTEAQIGVFAGVGNNSYYLRNILSHPEILDSPAAFQAMTANEKDYAATRIAHLLNTRGPAVSVGTACSTSLVAVCLAVQSLRAGTSDVALAGGVSVTSPLDGGYISNDGAMLSPDGHTRPFDASARGTVFSDGGGIVVLKRLEDATRDQDTIYGVIHGVGLSNDGGEKASFSAPSARGQAAAVRAALEDANIPPSKLSFVEAHGTGTAVGDPIEIEGITEAFATDAVLPGTIALGSLKGNIGHLTAGAGVAALIKATLALHHRLLPSSINCSVPHPAIPWNKVPVFVARENAPLDPQRLFGGVSSFGVGGTNAHVIIGAGELRTTEHPPVTEQSILPLASIADAQLGTMTDRITEWIQNHPEIPLSHVGLTLARGRALLPKRGALIIRRERGQIVRRLISANSKQQASSLVALFPGQGSHYPGMGQELYNHDRIFRSYLDQCVEIASPLLGTDLKSALWSDDRDTLRHTRLAQPALLALEYSLARAWQGHGIQFTTMIGHSLGEFTAATLAGVFSIEDAFRLVIARGALMDSLPAGKMLSVRAPRVAIEPLLSDTLTIASENAPALCVVSGASDAITSLTQQLNRASIPCKELHTSHAFHSSMIDPAVPPFLEIVRSVRLSPPSIPIVSTATGNSLTHAEATDPTYWATHMRRPVLFRAAVARVAENSNNGFIEIGPRATLATLTHQTVGTERLVLASLGESPGDEHEALLSALGTLWSHHFNFDPVTVYGPNARKESLPGYPFARTRYWIAPLARESIHEKQSVQSLSSIVGGSPMVFAVSPSSLIADLRGFFEKSSGLDLSHAEPTAHFVELGLDSLVLTQAALELQAAYKIPISFRQLMGDLSTLSTLSEYLLQNGAKPRTSQETTSMHAAPSTHSSDPSMFPQGSVEQLIASQLQMMSQQLQMLARSKSQPSATAPATSPSPSTPLQSAKPFGATPRISTTRENAPSSVNTRELGEFIHRYSTKTARSKEQTQRHRPCLADPRVVTGFSPTLKEVTYPIVVVRSSGSRMWDVDGNEYIDLLNGFGSNFFGHSAPYIKEAVSAQIERGVELGPMTPLAGEVATLVSELTGHARVAFCNTGSEAVMAAMRVARTVSGRKRIALFAGSYHGNFDEVVLRQVRGDQAIPASPGINPSMVENLTVLNYGTEEALAHLRERCGEYAAVLVEPVQSRRPDLQPREFLLELRAITEKARTALISDEVICGFRVHPAGAQGYFGFKADLATYGKVVGGGYPIGLLAGSPQWMDAVDGGQWRFGDASVPEVGVMYLAGTFVRHPLALAAAKAALTFLKSQGPSLQTTLNERSARLVQELNRFFEAAKAPVHIKHFGSLMKIVVSDNVKYSELLFHALRMRGIHVLDVFPCFLSLAHTDADIQTIVKAFQESVSDLQRMGIFSQDEALPVHNQGSGSDATPPVPGARLGRDKAGRPAWFIPDPKRPGRYMQIGEIQ